MSFSRLLLRLALGRRLPIVSGELRVPGPAAPIAIRRDRWGVPHIDAEGDADAHFAVGFCHGQDRAGQLEVMWRVVRGRLAEWVGPAAVGADRLSRRIGFRRAAEAQLGALGPDVRLAFESFAAGVNAGTTAGLPRKPHEFAVVGGTPSAWDAADALGVVKLQSFMLPSNWDVELARLRILLADGAPAVRDLDPLGADESGADGETGRLWGAEYAEGSGTPSREPSPARAGVAGSSVLVRLAAELDELRRYLPRGGGSNNWAVAGARTESGKPILASDPHLGPTCPPPWYLAHVRTPGYAVAGAGLAGSPGFAIGHNGFCAWGVTAGLTDNSDLFVETLGPGGKSVRQPDGTFVPCEATREVIRVRGAADAVEEVLVTPRGPVVTPAADVPVVLSLAAVWLEPRPLVGFFGAPTARSFDEFRGHFAAWPALPLNVLYADAGGTIGWQLVGELPTRGGGSGLVPRPADGPGGGWTGTVPFADMPFAANPACGYLATANDDPQWASDGGARPHPWLGADFIDDYRARRIRERLAARASGWTPAGCAALQLDVQSIPWREMRDAVLSLAPGTAEGRQALDLLGPWDGRVEADSPAAAVFELFVAELCGRVARARAPNAWRVALGDGGMGTVGTNLFADRRVAHLVRLVRDRPPGWFASWPAELEAALAAAVRTLRRAAGPAPAFWAWGHLRTLRLEHPLFGGHRWLGPAFNLGPVACGGDANTVSQAGARPTHPTDFTHNMANLRTVFDLGDLSKSTFVLCGGQSGNPLSPHHADQFPLWQRGDAVVIPWDQAAVVRAAVDTLRLLPRV
jgi:penicillin amidase